MTTPIKVQIAATLPNVAARAVLASLPLSFEAASTGEADVVLLDGLQPNWTDALAGTKGKQAVVVDPVVVARLDVGSRFLLDTPWGSNPVCADAAETLVKFIMEAAGMLLDRWDQGRPTAGGASSGLPGPRGRRSDPIPSPCTHCRGRLGRHRDVRREDGLLRRDTNGRCGRACALAGAHRGRRRRR